MCTSVSARLLRFISGSIGLHMFCYKSSAFHYRPAFIHQFLADPYSRLQLLALPTFPKCPLRPLASYPL